MMDPVLWIPGTSVVTILGTAVFASRVWLACHAGRLRKLSPRLASYAKVMASIGAWDRVVVYVIGGTQVTSLHTLVVQFGSATVDTGGIVGVGTYMVASACFLADTSLF